MTKEALVRIYEMPECNVRLPPYELTDFIARHVPVNTSALCLLTAYAEAGNVLSSQDE